MTSSPSALDYTNSLNEVINMENLPYHIYSNTNTSTRPTQPQYGHDTKPVKCRERKRQCENMISRTFSRDLRITGVSKKDSSWWYHIEVLDIRVSMSRFSNISTLDGHLQNDPVHTQLPPVVRYSVMRRYNDFRQLFLALRDHYGLDVINTLPIFPECGIFSYFYGDDPKLLQFRKDHLEKFLCACDEHEELKWSDIFSHFLCPDLDESTNQLEEPVKSSSTSSICNAGYVSLSYIKSPEIRFSKSMTSDDGGDWKRRKTAVTSFASVKKTWNLKSKLQNGREVDDVICNSASVKPCTELMKLLSLDPLPSQ